MHFFGNDAERTLQSRQAGFMMVKCYDWLNKYLLKVQNMDTLSMDKG